MKLEPAKIPIRLIAGVTCVALLTSCATAPQTARGPEYAPTTSLMREARSANVPVDKRAADYLQAAAVTAPLLGTGIGTPACETYNAACGELTVLLRSSEGGQLWNQPMTFSANSTAYHLRFEPATNAVWAPNYFATFVPADQIKEKLIRKENIHEGIGGALVGVRKVNPPEKFAPPRGITAPVTATLDFHAKDATLALRRPAKQPSATVQGKVRPLAANFSAPLSYYPPPGNLMVAGLLGGFKATSTPFDWVKTINGLQADPEIRKRYQFWVFAYPTGNPILYSALRLRQELAKADQFYPNHKPYVVVGHSMGGMLTHDQLVTLNQAMWEKALGQFADKIFKDNSSDSLIVRSTIFHANPRIARVVFICTPHRGSDLASNGIGKIGISLITLPARLTTVLLDSLTSADLAQITGSSKRLPNSITGLKPSNPALPIINSVPIGVPYHSIIGDRGKGDCPNCSDGVVAYWSSHLNGAQSEKIVPGPHGSCELPQTIAELDRILRLHLGISSASKTSVAQAGR